MSDDYAGDDLTGLSDSLGELYEKLTERDDRQADQSTPEPIDHDWQIKPMVLTMVPLLAALSVLQMVSGSVLEAFEEVLLTNPALLILVPVQIGTAGNLGSIMCSRLSTQLHLGTFEFAVDNPEIRSNSGAILGLGVTVFTLVGVAAWAIGRALGGTLGLVEVLTISLVSGTLLAVFVVVVSLVAVSTSYRLGYNPDDTTIPVVTNVCDITGVLILFAVITVVL